MQPDNISPARQSSNKAYIPRATHRRKKRCNRVMTHSHRADNLNHPEHPSWRTKTVASKMLTSVPFAHENMSLADVSSLLTRTALHFDEIPYIYVVDDEHRLVGVLSIKQLFTGAPHTKVGKIAQRRGLSTVTLDTSQEHAAHLALRNDLTSLPVVGDRNVLLGILTSSTIRAIIHREAREDLLRLSGIHHHHLDFDDGEKIPTWTAVRHRLPWLLVGLMGGMAVASVVGYFESILASNIILASFIPLIVYMGAAVGTQTEAFVIRDFAIQHKLRFIKYIIKQLGIVTALATATAIALIPVALVLYHSMTIAIVLGVSLFFAVLSSILTGLAIPLVLTKIRMDPANASGPVATIIQDILSVTIYFLVASILL